jgi:primosomal protein N' (replication factor Y)
MYYYAVWVRSSRYHGNEPLTYASATRLSVGSIVEVELQRNMVLGVVSSVVDKPKFQTKEINLNFDLPPIPPSLIKLCQWIITYYPAPLGVVTQQLIPGKFSAKQLELITEIPNPVFEMDSLPPLNMEQVLALANMQDSETYLLHGRTGSGKTRLYMELAAKVLKDNKSAIILTPEISLTSQLGSNFKSVFGKNVVVMHSKQSQGQRQKAWLDCLRADQPLIIIGPRSVLFAPVKNLGLIVLDEEHEGAYKQDQAPHYQTSRVAAYLAKQTHSSLILGSATPLITDYFLAQQKNRPIIELKQLANQNSDHKVETIVVDRKDNSLFNRSPYLSQRLIEEIELGLTNGEQSLLYLNRRGTARLVMCENCGWQAVCPHCDIPLTYHGDNHEVRCHSCNYHSKAPVNCPSCLHPDMVFKTAGTKAIASEVQKIFPNARVARFDTDNLKADSFEQNYDDAREGKIDILVGTQMLAKGLDLPKLSLVGVLLADTSLYIPDYSAQERTFQLINQVLGRIGRGHIAGKAVIQTYNPDNKILNFAIKSDYKNFYEAELLERKQFLFPPFCYLLKLSVRRTSIKNAESAANKLKNMIESDGYKVRVEGPAPSFHERFQGKYQWQLVVKAVVRHELIKIIENLPSNWSYDIDPMDLL